MEFQLKHSLSLSGYFGLYHIVTVLLFIAMWYIRMHSQFYIHYFHNLFQCFTSFFIKFISFARPHVFHFNFLLWLFFFYIYFVSLWNKKKKAVSLFIYNMVMVMCICLAFPCYNSVKAKHMFHLMYLQLLQTHIQRVKICI